MANIFAQLKLDVVMDSAKVTAGFKNIDKVLKDIDKSIKKVGQSSQRTSGQQLSMLFGFMALGRAATNALTAIKNSYDKVENNTSALSQATMGLSASWEFLKFSIFNALDQPYIISFVSTLIDMINWVSDLINKFPALGAAIVLALGALAVVGVGGALYKSWQLFAAGFGATGEGTVLGGLGKISTAFGGLQKLFGLGLVITTAFDIFGNKDTPLSKELFLRHLFEGAGAGFLLAGPAGALAGATIAIAVDGLLHSEELVKKAEELQQKLRDMLSGKQEATVPEKVGTAAKFGYADYASHVSQNIQSGNPLQMGFAFPTAAFQVATDFINTVKGAGFDKKMMDSQKAIEANAIALGNEKTGLNPFLQMLSTKYGDSIIHMEGITKAAPGVVEAHRKEMNAVNEKTNAYERLAKAMSSASSKATTATTLFNTNTSSVKPTR